MVRKSYSAALFIAAIEGSEGVVATVLKRVGCGSNTFYRWLKRPTVKEAWETATILGLGEDHSFLIESRNTQRKLMRNGEDYSTADAKWLLSRLGKHIGFGNDPVAVQVTQNVTTVADFKRGFAARKAELDELEE